MKKQLIAALLTPILITLSGCFTGVESTPKIAYKESKDKKAEGSSYEESLAKSFVTQDFLDWKMGKPFYVASDRINLVLTPDSPASSAPSVGKTLLYKGYQNVTDLTGNEIVELTFSSADNPGETFTYRTNATLEELKERKKLQIPFTIDLDLLAKVHETIVGENLYIKTSLWYNKDGSTVNGRKFIPVHITDVQPANEIYPYMILFTDNNGAEHALFMSLHTGTRWNPRELPSLFSFTDPRANYPQITDEMWNHITHSRVARGMTKTEVMLALGNPLNIDRGHTTSSAYERWSYSDGVYLVFEDGLLIQFNR